MAVMRTPKRKHRPVQVVGIPQAGRLLGVSRQRAWQMVKEGKLRCVVLSPKAFAVYRIDVDRLVMERFHAAAKCRGVNSRRESRSI
jgi:predicted site-specific integrase-resolvase